MLRIEAPTMASTVAISWSRRPQGWSFDCAVGVSRAVEDVYTMVGESRDIRRRFSILMRRRHIVFRALSCEGNGVENRQAACTSCLPATVM